MRKLILTGATFLLMATAYAQTNTATLSQNGEGNVADLYQEGQNQLVTVVQDGTSNQATTSQISTYAQEIFLSQTGTSNQAFVYQEEDAGPNYVQIFQNGTGNFAGVDQSFFLTYYAEAYINQTGDNHTATIEQIFAIGSVAGVEQTGTGVGNLAEIVQTDYSLLDRAEIKQNGQRQQAGILQYGNIYGEGENEAYINQSSDFSQTAIIYQSGDYNVGEIYQENGAGPGNLAVVDQLGAVNSGYIDQSDVLTIASEASILQTGLYNSAGIEQFGSILGVASIEQTGNDNVAYIGQGADPLSGNLEGLGNTATVTQNGDLNLAGVYQLGDDNVATLTQTGDDNVIGNLTSTDFALQQGSLNELTVSQTGTGLLVQVQQVGDGHSAVITQSSLVP